MSGHYYTAHPAKIDFLFEGNLIIIRAMGQQLTSYFLIFMGELVYRWMMRAPGFIKGKLVSGTKVTTTLEML